jgi:drug/metabolite transporter (DMT)-like permease
MADWPRIRPRLLYLLVLGAVGFSGFNIALYSAVVYTSGVNVSIEQAAIPLLILIANFLLFGQRAPLVQIVGFLVSVVGVAITASHGDPARLLSLDLNIGDLMMLGAVVAYAGYTVALRFKPDVHWQSLMIVLMAGATIVSVPTVWMEIGGGTAIFPDARGWAVILYGVIFPSILGQVFYVRGVELIGANRAGLFVNLVPVFGTLLSLAILREPFHLHHAIALALVLGGIWLAEIGGRRAAA